MRRLWPLGRSGRETLAIDEPIFIIHIMKSAGTTLRKMLGRAVGDDAVYPSPADLAQFPKGWYPDPTEMAEQIRSGALSAKRIFIGHQPYALRDVFPVAPFTIAFLRDPVARSVSMMDHRRRKYPDTSYDEFLDNEHYVDRSIRNYQTKTFAFDTVEECAGSIHTALDIDDARFARARDRVDALGFSGTVENYGTDLARLADRLGVRFGKELHANATSASDNRVLSPSVRQKIEALTALDMELYERVRSRAHA
jgi:hypothetical protein